MIADGSTPPTRGRGGATSRSAPPNRSARDRQPGNTARPSTDNADAATIRAWARSNGYDISTRGAISAAVRDADLAANPS